MFLNIVKAFGEIVDIGFKLKDRLIPDLDKAGISYFLITISNLLSYVCEELENNRYPHSQCGEMYSYMKAFQSKLEGKISKEELTYLSTLIQECYQVERLLGQLNQLDNETRVLNLNKLKEVSGQFRAASELIKI